jgi:hypothetical protein
MIFGLIDGSFELGFLVIVFPTIFFAGMHESRCCQARKRLVTHFSARPRVFALRLALHHILAS